MNGDATGAAAPDGAVLRGASPRAYLALLRNSSFRNLMVASLIATLGDWVGVLAIIALTQELLGPTRGALFGVSGVMVARVMPSLLLGPVAGVLVDRWDRKRILVVTNLGRGTVMALIPFTDEYLTLLLATLLIELMSTMFAPAKDAVLPTLVQRHELVLANQVNLVVTYGTLPLGGVLNAGLIGLANQFAPEATLLGERAVALPIWFNAAAFIIGASLLATLHLPHLRVDQPSTDTSMGPGAWDQFTEGFRFIGGHPVVRALILGVMAAFATAGAVITSGHFFAGLLNAGQSGYGILVAAVGVGMLAGLVAAAPLTDRLEPEWLFAPGIGLAGFALVVTATMPTLTLAALSAVVMGASAGVAFIVGYTVLQQRSRDDIRGRTFGAFNSGVRFAIFGSTIAAPALIGVLGPERRVLTPLEDGGQAFLYPYTFGGGRITLIAAGALAIVGAVLSGRALHNAVRRERELALPATRGRAGVGHGLLVVFEGGDGAGKTTQIRLLRSAVERSGHDTVVTREPGGTAVGEAVRDILLSPDTGDLAIRTEALLYAAARAQHVAQVIEPALEKGAVVLCDRFVDSSIVYQGAARGLGEEQIEELNRWATGGLVPDVVILLDLDPVDGLKRASADADLDRMESAGLPFHRLVADAYRRLARADPGRYLVLDATRPVEDLHAAIRDAVLRRLTDADATGPAGDGGDGPSGAAHGGVGARGDDDGAVDAREEAG